jgi:hypothetical protein
MDGYTAQRENENYTYADRAESHFNFVRALRNLQVNFWLRQIDPRHHQLCPVHLLGGCVREISKLNAPCLIQSFSSSNATL